MYVYMSGYGRSACVLMSRLHRYMHVDAHRRHMNVVHVHVDCLLREKLGVTWIHVHTRMNTVCMYVHVNCLSSENVWFTWIHVHTHA
jgi:hypothetical protein